MIKVRVAYLTDILWLVLEFVINDRRKLRDPGNINARHVSQFYSYVNTLLQNEINVPFLLSVSVCFYYYFCNKVFRHS